MDESTVLEIWKVFTREKEVVRQMLALSEQKKASIIGGDVKKLGRILESEEVLSYDLKELERRRVVLTDALAEQLGRKGRELTLLEIAGMAESPADQHRLNALRAELIGMLRKLERLNKINRELLRRKLNYIDAMLGLLTQDEPIGGTYDSTGSMDGRYRSTGLFDQSI
ncbi:MAG: flagellar protein FlgN [Clostridiales bacterium]|nr:flagellar protein FlgN [Clostridiales bacterium]